MKRFHRCALLVVFCFLVSGLLVRASADDGLKKPLDHSSYDEWNQISGSRLSQDGQWLIYSLRPGKGETTLKVRELSSQREYIIERGTSAQFTYDNCYAICIVQPDPDAVKAARKAKKPAAEQPQSSLLILDLKSGQTRTVARVRSFTLPEKAADWVAISMASEPVTASAAKTESAVKQVEQIASPATSKPAAEENKQQKKPEKTNTEKTAKEPGSEKKKSPEEDDDQKKEKSAGSELVLKNLATGMETKFPFVSSHRFSRNGQRLALAISVAKEQNAPSDGIMLVDLPELKSRQVVSGPGHYRNLTFDEAGELFAFLTDRDTYQEKKPQNAIYYLKKGSTKPTSIVTSESEGMPSSWQIPESSSLRFSKNGKSLFFSTQPLREEEEEKKKDADDDDDKPVRVDIWHWQDPWLQPMQLLRAEMEKRRTYPAVVHLEKGDMRQLGTSDIPNVTTGDEGNARHALGTSDLPYRKLISWEYPGYQDVYLVDTLTGKTVKVLEKARSRPSWSPKAKYITWWDAQERAWYGMSVTARKPIKLSDKIRFAVHDELNDIPSPPRGYGLGGWTDDDKEVLIYDRFDIWAVDPRRPTQPRCITEGIGRRESIRFRITQLDREARSVSAKEPIILSAFNEKDKSSGYYRDHVAGEQEPSRLLMKNERISPLSKAQAGDTVIFTRSTFQRFPDLWTSTLAFDKIKRISRANPQQVNYSWGSAELTEWKSTDGQTLHGILYKPEDFDPKQKYPLLVYFYERSSDGLHRYSTPGPSSSIINFSFYVSRGYVLFVPDIPYKTGYPGRSAENAVLPGIAHIVKQGFIDEKAIGVQGHSWGGYQIAHLVTRTNVFTAAESGAPVSNMTHAYGGIRWASGMSRMFQYERTQSRIGDTLWNARDLYLENSPLFHADKIETPLLILHNDEDEAVPWYQGIELFVAMRRLSKPAWLINYNGEGHGVSQDQNRRDWSVRMQQFFDHYLKGEPAPKWITEGVPATEKGKSLGLELEKK